MRLRTVAALLFAFHGLAGTSAIAADLPLKTVYAPPLPFLWSGFYVGGHTGALLGTTTFSDPYGPSLYGDKVTTPGFMAGLQLGYNWRVTPQWVVGVETDASLLSSDGTNTCLEASIRIIGSNCSSAPKALATFTGRLGYVADPQGRTLVYGKAGAAWTRNDVTMTPNNAFENAPSTVVFTGDPRIQGSPVSKNASVWGWTVGAGVERALTPAWSLNLEYDYHRFSSAIATPQTIDVTITGGVTDIPAGDTSRMTQNLHLVKLGLNYRWGVDPMASWASGGPMAYAAAMPIRAQRAWWPGWEIDVGARYWYSSGKFQSENGNLPVLVSRLTYDGMTGHSGEVFGRVDSPFNVFVKGFAGGGSITSGKQFDEDWGIQAPGLTSFEVTQSTITGSLSYATGDVGFNVMRGPDHKVGLFVGYNYFHDYLDTRGCTQLVAPAPNICAPPLPSSSLGTSETDNWHSLRVGVSAEARMWERFKITGDLAYLPYVRLDGLDNHRGRDIPTYFPARGTGNGVQAELILSYLATENLSFGIGGRYWAMWTTDASQSCTGNCDINVSTVTSEPPAPLKASTNRYGGFLQASYTFNPLR